MNLCTHCGIAPDCDDLLTQALDELTRGTGRRIKCEPSGCVDIDPALLQSCGLGQEGRSRSGCGGDDAYAAAFMLLQELGKKRHVQRDPAGQYIWEGSRRTLIGRVAQVQACDPAKL